MNYRATAGTAGTYTPDNLVAGNANLLVSWLVTVAEGQTLERGAVLGLVTAAENPALGHYALSLSAATDGSEAPDVVLAEDCDASEAARPALVYARGDFNDRAITLGTGHTVASVREGLRGKGIWLIPSLEA